LPLTASRWTRSEESRGAPVSRRQPPERIPKGAPDATIRLAGLPRGARGRIDEGDIMLWIIGGGLLLLWLVGFTGQVGGAYIHLFLVAALILFARHYVTGRRNV
jgi:hypothetical protein